MALNRVSTQEMRVVANSVEQLVRDYTRQVQALFQTGWELDRMWDGVVGSTFGAQLGQDQARFESLTKVIGLYIQSLRESAVEYDRLETNAVQTIRNNTVRRI